MTDSKWRDENELYRLHWEEGLTYEEMADRLGCSTSCVSKWMNKLDVERRPPGRTPKKELQSPELLRELYHTEQMTLKEIANKIGSDQSTVAYFMEKHGIERRSRSESSKLAMLTAKHPHYGLMFGS